jgi:hypothetical protein
VPIALLKQLTEYNPLLEEAGKDVLKCYIWSALFYCEQQLERSRDADLLVVGADELVSLHDPVSFRFGASTPLGRRCKRECHLRGAR